MSTKNELINQIRELERVNDKIESIINHERRYLLDSIIIDYILSQRSKLELAIHVSKFSLNNTDETLLKSIYDANSGLSIDLLENQLDYYIELISIK